MTAEEELEAELAAGNEETKPTESAENTPKEEAKKEEGSDQVESTGDDSQPEHGSNEPESIDERTEASPEVAASEAPDAGKDQGGVSNDQEPVNAVVPRQTGELSLKGGSSAESWAAKLTESLTVQFGGGYSVNKLGMIEVSGSVDAKSLYGALEYLSDSEINASNISTSLGYNIGKFVLEIASREDKDISVVVSEQCLCEQTGRSLKTIYDWVNVAKLPEECFMYGLTMTHYVNATKVSLPRDDKQRKKFLDKRIEILEEASKSPGTTSRDVKNRLYDVSRALTTSEAGKDEPQPESVSNLWRNTIDLQRFKEAATVDPELLKSRGVTMADVTNHIEYGINELVNRNCITDAPENVMFYWEKNDEPIEAEATVIPDKKGDKKSDAFLLAKSKAAAAKKNAAKKKTTKK